MEDTPLQLTHLYRKMHPLLSKNKPIMELYIINRIYSLNFLGLDLMILLLHLVLQPQEHSAPSMTVKEMT